MCLSMCSHAYGDQSTATNFTSAPELYSVNKRSSIFSENAEVCCSYPRNLYFLFGILCITEVSQRRSKAAAVLDLYKIPIFSRTWNKMHGMQQAIWLISREIANISNVSRWYRKIWCCVSLCFPYIDLCPCSSPHLQESSCEVCSLTKHRPAWSLCLLFSAFLIGFHWLFFKHDGVKSICSGVNHVTSRCLCKHFLQFAALLPRYFQRCLPEQINDMGVL